MLKQFIMCTCLCTFWAVVSTAQSFNDHVYMPVGKLCVGATYGQSGWSEYWEGTTLRSNTNMGSWKNRSVTTMVALGIQNRINILASLPWMNNELTVGSLRPEKGLQDINLGVKYLLYGDYDLDYGIKFSLVGQFGTPLGGYYVDYQPIALGMGTTNLGARLIGSWQSKKGLYVRAHAGTTHRSNVNIDVSYYYTDKPYYTNEVVMPNTSDFGGALGFRNKHFRLEAAYLLNNTIGGTDIRKDLMPFVSNNMDQQIAQGYGQFFIPGKLGLSIIGSYFMVPSGRNVGKSTGFNVGILWQPTVWKTATTATTN